MRFSVDDDSIGKIISDLEDYSTELDKAFDAFQDELRTIAERTRYQKLVTAFRGIVDVYNEKICVDLRRHLIERWTEEGESLRAFMEDMDAGDESDEAVGRIEDRLEEIYAHPRENDLAGIEIDADANAEQKDFDEAAEAFDKLEERIRELREEKLREFEDKSEENETYRFLLPLVESIGTAAASFCAASQKEIETLGENYAERMSQMQSRAEEAAKAAKAVEPVRDVTDLFTFDMPVSRSAGGASRVGARADRRRPGGEPDGTGRTAARPGTSARPAAAAGAASATAATVGGAPDYRRLIQALQVFDGKACEYSDLKKKYDDHMAQFDQKRQAWLRSQNDIAAGEAKKLWNRLDSQLKKRHKELQYRYIKGTLSIQQANYLYDESYFRAHALYDDYVKTLQAKLQDAEQSAAQRYNAEAARCEGIVKRILRTRQAKCDALYQRRAELIRRLSATDSAEAERYAQEIRRAAQEIVRHCGQRCPHILALAAALKLEVPKAAADEKLHRPDMTGMASNLPAAPELEFDEESDVAALAGFDPNAVPKQTAAPGMDPNSSHMARANQKLIDALNAFSKKGCAQWSEYQNTLTELNHEQQQELKLARDKWENKSALRQFWISLADPRNNIAAIENMMNTYYDNERKRQYNQAYNRCKQCGQIVLVKQKWIAKLKKMDDCSNAIYGLVNQCKCPDEYCKQMKTLRLALNTTSAAKSSSAYLSGRAQINASERWTNQTVLRSNALTALGVLCKAADNNNAEAEFQKYQVYDEELQKRIMSYSDTYRGLFHKNIDLSDPNRREDKMRAVNGYIDKQYAEIHTNGEIDPVLLKHIILTMPVLATRKELEELAQEVIDQKCRYVGVGCKKGPNGTNAYTNFDEGYRAALDKRMNNADQQVKEVFLQERDQLQLLSDNWTLNSHFIPGKPGVNLGVNLNSAEDMTNARGVGTTFFHEMGHALDYQLGSKHSTNPNVPIVPISMDQSFIDALLKDRQDLILQCKENSQAEAATRAEISRKNNTAPNDYHKFNSCSDIHEGMRIHIVIGGKKASYDGIHSCVKDNNNKLVGPTRWGRYGHDNDTNDYNYWKGDKNLENNKTWRCRLATEAFAHMFEAYMGDSLKLQNLQKYYPNACQAFYDLVKGEREIEIF